MKYKTIYADPPWWESGGGSAHKPQRGAQRHYPLMKTREIIKMADTVKGLADDNAHLYLWVTNNFLKDGLAVMDAWGFTYKTTITWLKPHMGLGQYFRGITEHCLFGTRGRLPFKTTAGKREQGITGFRTLERLEHSRKPEIMRMMIEKVSYPPYIELFARRATPGWDTLGNETVMLPYLFIE